MHNQKVGTTLSPGSCNGLVVRNTTQAEPERAFGPIGSTGFAIVIGASAGLGAVAFRGLIAVIHNLLFTGTLSATYNANLHTPAGPWGVGIVLVPVIGSLGVTLLVTRFAPEAKGHGVPEVIDAVFYGKGAIRPSVTWIKALASALSIGSGGSVGREGPIIQIGSALGSWLGHAFRVPTWERITWLACGAGGGIAATFNTPIGGILFATEIILQEVSVRTLVPVALSTATASYVGRMFFGASPAFSIPERAVPLVGMAQPAQILAYAGLGLVLGVLSELFIQSIYRSEDIFEAAIPGRPFLRHMVGMFAVGLILYGFLRLAGHYYVEGVGYSTIQDLLSGRMDASGSLLAFVLLLFAVKLAVTSLTLGSGASGGVFSPALYLGAMSGEAYGLLLHQLLPRLNSPSARFAVVGMAGMVGGSTGAAVTAIVMVYEMTLDYAVIIPMTVTVALSYGVRTLISHESIYTLKLRRRGHAVPDALQANLAFGRRVSEFTDRNFSIFPASMPVGQFLDQAENLRKSRYFLTEEQGQARGVFIFEDALRVLRETPDSRLEKVASTDFITIRERASLALLMERLRRRNAHFVLVLRGDMGSGGMDVGNVRGILPKERIVDTLVEESELFSVEAG